MPSFIIPRVSRITAPRALTGKLPKNPAKIVLAKKFNVSEVTNFSTNFTNFKCQICVFAMINGRPKSG